MTKFNYKMPIPTRHAQIISDWLLRLQQSDQVLAVWLEGSLSLDRGHPSSDIDIRIVIDGDYHLADVLPNIEERISVNNGKGFVRSITPDGIVIDLDVYNSIKARGIQVGHYQMLFSKMGDFLDEDRNLLRPEIKSPSSKLLPEDLSQMTIDFTVVMAALPSMFYTNEYHSAMLQADLSRIDLVKVIYHLMGIEYAQRYKHLSSIMSERMLSDLQSTYNNHNTPQEISQMLITIFDLIGKYMQELSDKIGGGFDASWYWRIYENIIEQLVNF